MHPTNPDPPDLINLLPDGCLTSIISRVHLDSLPLRRTDTALHHPIHCALVCRHWASLADHAVTHLHFQYEETWDDDRESFSIHPSLGPSLPRFPFLRSLRFKNLYPEDLSSVLSSLSLGSCPLLESFQYSPPRLGFYHPSNYYPSNNPSPLPPPRPQDLDGAELGAALRHCPLLREVMLLVERVDHGAALNSALRALPRLARLDVGQIDRGPLALRQNNLRNDNRGLHDAHEGLIHLTSLVIRHQSEGIPLASTVGSLPLLEDLMLEYCFYLDLPSSLCDLANLRTLHLVGLSHLQSLPASLGRLLSLERLEIKSCPSLTTLPQSLGDLSALRRLGLNFCRSLRELPGSFGRLSSLEKLAISQSLDYLPQSLGLLHSLQKLKLDCDGMPSLPEALGSLQSLTSLHLYGSGPRELPECVGNLASLQSLDVNVPSLARLPESLGQMKGLTLLKIGREVELPEALGDLESLKCLTLCECLRLPRSLGRLSALETLSLVHCRMGSLPEEIGGLARLKELSLLRWEELPLLPECMLEMQSLRAVVIMTVRMAEQGHPSLVLIRELRRRGVLVEYGTHYRWFENL